MNLITKNILLVLKTGDINRLSKKSYNFLYLMSGFIAHYNHNGFMGYYQDTEDLRRDILQSSDLSNPDYYLESFFQKSDTPHNIKMAEHYREKSAILNELKKLIYSI